jgi:hypothetical protein
MKKKNNVIFTVNNNELRKVKYFFEWNPLNCVPHFFRGVFFRRLRPEILNSQFSINFSCIRFRSVSTLSTLTLTCW